MKQTALLTASILALTIGLAHAHCQIPCGIYGDAARFDTMLEHATTITKSITEIKRLSGSSDNANQTVRWVTNKETHAQMIQDIIGDYFLAQRIKETQSDYTERLTLSHKIIVMAMKTKQSSDLTQAEGLVKAIEAFKVQYFTE
jgi:nickel superoxide dismutase